MRCSGSPTTCTAPEPTAPVVRTLEAMIFSEILRPLAARLGPAGQLALDATAQRIFVEQRGRER